MTDFIGKEHMVQARFIPTVIDPDQFVARTDDFLANKNTAALSAEEIGALLKDADDFFKSAHLVSVAAEGSILRKKSFEKCLLLVNEAKDFAQLYVLAKIGSEEWNLLIAALGRGISHQIDREVAGLLKCFPSIPREKPGSMNG